MLYNTVKRGADKAKYVLASPCWSSIEHYPAFRRLLVVKQDAEMVNGVADPLTDMAELRDARDTGAARVDKKGETLDRVGL